jgi:hypothetical protein|tara:strand:+ start:808 stop:1128 length:321 start_codon:yes stop_codon:yes gene_type:complete
MKIFLVTFISCLAVTVVYCQDLSPCEDSLFVELSEKPLQSLSEREYEYYITFSERCAEYIYEIAGDAPEDLQNPKRNSVDIEEFKLAIEFIRCFILLFFYLSSLNL